MHSILREEEGDVVVLRMCHGKVQALDLELVEALGSALAELAADPPAALVLTGSGSSFSAGVDLFRVVEGGREYIEPFLAGLERVFRGLFAFPRPALAAINGHAIAGGMVLACACDERVLARGNARLAIPELLVGVAFPATALEIVRSVVSPHSLGDLLWRGKRVDAEESLSVGLVDELVESDRLLPRTLARARELGGLDRRAFELAKRQLRGPSLAFLEAYGPGHDAEVLAQWCDPSTARAIGAYLERIVGKR